MKRLRPYMAYSHAAGSGEGAALVFDFSAKGAKLRAWRQCGWDISSEWIDLYVKWIRNESNVLPLANQEKLANNEPHIVDAPAPCSSCNMWGVGLDSDGRCSWCGEYPGDVLLEAMTAVKEGES